MIILFTVSLSLLILLPIAKKCEIGLKSAIIGSISIGFATAIILYVLVRNITLNSLQLFIIDVGLIFILAASISIYRCYRDPERIPPGDPNIIVSPADGTVKYVKKVESGRVPSSTKAGNLYYLEELTNTDQLKDALYTIGISMNVLNVHVNRTPVKGQVVFLKYIPGKFISLKKEQAPIKNERVTIVIDNDTFKVAVVQIASRLVRRIQSYLVEGQEVEIGQRLGMIKFGSQVDLVIPHIKNLRIEVVPGVEVKAGVSVLARYN